MSATPLVIWLPEPIPTASRACLSAGTSLTPSPIIATKRPRSVSAATSAFFCSGVIRQKTVLRSAAWASPPLSSGRSGPSITWASSGIPTAWATAVTVSRASPEISLRSTCWSRMYCTVSAASGRSVSSSTTSARGSSRGGGSAAGSDGSPPRASPNAITRRPAPVCSASARWRPSGRARAPARVSTSGAPIT